MFKEIEHTADYAIKVWGADLSELFVDAAHGMNALTGGKLDRPETTREIALEAADPETLLVTWLEELAFLMEVEGEMYSHFEVLALTDTALRVRARGGMATGVDKLIKAVTFHNLAIRENKGGPETIYETTIVFDV
ncbi:MAG: archease [Anaerolineales bacterium]|nr:archease [Anaerolineales bacterium]